MKHRLPVFLLAALVFGGLTACDTTQAPPYHPPSRGSMAAPAPAKTGAPRARPSAQMPRVMILVDEQSLGTIPTAEVEAMAIRMLLDQGVQVVDQDMTQSNLAKGQELFRIFRGLHLPPVKDRRQEFAWSYEEFGNGIPDDIPD